eukprot:6211505-Pleurochrysis_carterae.AAC.1
MQPDEELEPVSCAVVVPERGDVVGGGGVRRQPDHLVAVKHRVGAEVGLRPRGKRGGRRDMGNRVENDRNLITERTGECSELGKEPKAGRKKLGRGARW